jgi:hypothetical protein
MAADPPGSVWVEGVITSVTPAFIPPVVTNTRGNAAQAAPVEASTPASLGVEDYYGGANIYQLSHSATVTIDQLPAKFTALRPGMEVYVNQLHGVITAVEAFSTAVSGYIVPESKMVPGRVLSINRNEIQLKTGSGALESFYLTPATVADRRGLFVPLDSIYVGDKVKLYFDQYASPEVTRIAVEGTSIIISGVSKGKLQSVNRTTNRLVLRDISSLGSGVWHSGAAATLNLDWSTDMSLYAGARQITYTYLPYYQGQNVYWVTQNVMGKERIARMVVQSGYESTYQGQIQDIGIAHEVLKLNNNKNIALHEGSIVIHDGRLQEVNSLTPGMDVYVIADGTLPAVTAEVIYILNDSPLVSDLSQYRIYAGPMDVLMDQSIRLDHFFMLEDNEWVNYADAQELYYDDDTKIFDVNLNRALTAEDFILGDYYANHYVYAYTVGDRCIGIWVDQRLRLPRTIAAGTIAGQRSNLPNNRDITLTLKEERWWLSEEWTFTPPTDKHFLENAMIVLEDKVISAEELKIGDRLYLICNGNVPRLAIVK